MHTTTRQDYNAKESNVNQMDIKKELYREQVQSKIKLEKLLKTLERNWEDAFESWETPVINKPVKDNGDANYTKETMTVKSMDVKEAQKQLQKEIETNKRFSLGSKTNKKWICPKHNRSSCSYLKLHSTSSEIKHWLEVKGFSEKSQAILDSLNGEMLFSLKKEQLEKYLGEEGCRLYSHIMIQRNISGVKTTRSEELRSILEQRRRLMEENESSSSEIGVELDEDEKIDNEITAKLLQFLAKQSTKKSLN
ncbi:epidermal growth factor receptor kinase substrate 8-like [Centruroides vittatus]|uniref:epidermal growth factor receptor kinase substrate 8-like n=1 Tax=Centruroides vittatus TaxID=120091 RepID=UPI0035109481